MPICHLKGHRLILLKVYLLQYGKIPAINVKLVLNTGKVNEAPGQQNYSDIVSNAILMGNSKYDAETQSNKAFALGTALSASSTNDNTPRNARATAAFSRCSSRKADRNKLSRLRLFLSF